MKILRIITRLNVGGPAIQAINLITELQKLGYETVLVTGISPKHEGSMDKILFKKSKSNFIVIASLVREINPKKDYYAFRALVRVIRREKPDIVHTHMAKAGLLGRAATLWVRLFYGHRAKLIHTYHGHVFHSYFGWWKSKLFVWLERIVGWWTDAIVVISESQRKDIVEGYKIVPKRKVRLIPLGFDLDRLLELGQFEKKWEALRIGIIGRLTAIKNHELFFDFIKSLEKHFTVFSYVIGDGERRQELEKIAKEKGIRARFVGWIVYKSMPELYGNLDLIVCASKNEGTPVALIEAMAAGRLVVSTPVGGVVDLIGLKQERGYYLYEDSIWITVEMLKMDLKDSYYKGKIERAREYVTKNYGLDRLVADIDNLYKKMK